jgi:cysteine synthase
MPSSWGWGSGGTQTGIGRFMAKNSPVVELDPPFEAFAQSDLRYWLYDKRLRLTA